MTTVLVTTGIRNGHLRNRSQAPYSVSQFGEHTVLKQGRTGATGAADTTRTDVTSRTYNELLLHATCETLSTVFWDVTPHTVVADLRFGGTYCCNHEGHRKKPAKIKYSFLAWLSYC
jgi:hypothetical protein